MQSQLFQLLPISDELYSSSRKKFHALSNSSLSARTPFPEATIVEADDDNSVGKYRFWQRLKMCLQIEFAGGHTLFRHDTKSGEKYSCDQYLGS
jgi:hypothetical protein